MVRAGPRPRTAFTAASGSRYFARSQPRFMRRWKSGRARARVAGPRPRVVRRAAGAARQWVNRLPLGKQPQRARRRAVVAARAEPDAVERRLLHPIRMAAESTVRTMAARPGH